MLYIVIAVLVLLFLITIHELGHYLFGKLFKFKIKEFAIGFGPAIFSYTNKKTGEKFSIRIFPLGGYCAFQESEFEVEEVEVIEDSFGNKMEIPVKKKVEAEVLEDGTKYYPPEATPIRKEDDFSEQKPWKRLIVIAGGAIFNFIFGIIFCVILLVSIGYDLPQVRTISPHTPTADSQLVSNPNWYENDAGEWVSRLQAGDVILRVDGKRLGVLHGNTIVSAAQGAKEGDTLIFRVRRGGNEIDVPIVVYKGPIRNVANTDYAKEEGKILEVLQLGMSSGAYRHSFGEALVRAPEVGVGMFVALVGSFAELFTGEGLEELSGPITSIGTIADFTRADPGILLVFLPLISMNLAIFNLLPIPALDGGRMVFIIIEWIRRKPIKREIEAMVHGIGFLALLAFIIILEFSKLLM
ncbi:MAG: site-2 protease family protein [Firmicutes bacterium]|nr:site-2 protease family protein [Bacillota bacterium]